MGKRKRHSDHTRTDRSRRFCTSSETVPCSPEMEHCSEEASCAVVHDDVRPVLDSADRLIKLVNAHPTDTHHQQSLGRSILLKRSRHHYGHQYSRRHSGHHANASSSRGKGTFCDDKCSFKFASQSNSNSGQFSEYRENTFFRLEKISRSSVMDTVSADVAKMICALCEKPLSRRLYFLGNPVSSSNELSVVAVLVCGHAYHGDCLEHRTNPEERWDPPCPLCSGLLSQISDSSAQ